MQLALFEQIKNCLFLLTNIAIICFNAQEGSLINVKGNLKMIFKAIRFLATRKKKTKKTKRHGISNEEKAGIERRRYPRLDMKIAVNYLAYSSIDSMQEYQARTKNISGGGVCISTVNCITRNTIIELGVKMPGYSSIINALACVVYSRERRMDNGFDTGICFTNISSEEEKYITEYANRVIQDTNMEKSEQNN